MKRFQLITILIVLQGLFAAGCSESLLPHVSDISTSAVRSNQIVGSPEAAKLLALNNFEESEAGILLKHPSHTVNFGKSGIIFQPNRGSFAWDWRLSSVSVSNGKTSKSLPVNSTVPELDKLTVSYPRGVLTERYLAKEMTIEQQFVIPEPLALSAEQDLIISGAVKSAANFEVNSKGWLWRGARGVVSLGSVRVFDATGRELPASMEVTANTTQIKIAGDILNSAVYPVLIDPEIGSNDFRISEVGGTGNANFDAEKVSVAYNSTNNEYLVVWVGDPATGSLIDNEFEIFGQRIDAATGAEVGTNDFRISSMFVDGDASITPDWPKVAYNSVNNEYLVVWSSDDVTAVILDNQFEIFGQRLNAATGAEVGVDDFRISTKAIQPHAGYDSLQPAVAYNSTTNEYLVVWSGSDSGGGYLANEFEIRGRRVAGATGALAGAQQVYGPSGGIGVADITTVAPNVAFNSVNNEFLVVWQSRGAAVTGTEIYGQRVNGTTGVPAAALFQISDMGPDTSYSAYAPEVAYNPDANEYLVVWSGDDNSGALADNELEIYGQRLNASNGAEVGLDDFRISDAGVDGSLTWIATIPTVSYNTLHQTYLVVWGADDNASGLADGEYEIHGQFLDSAGNEIGDNDFRISDMGSDGDASYATSIGLSFFDVNEIGISFNPNSNEYFVVWLGDDNDVGLANNEFEVFGQRILGARADLSLSISDSSDPALAGTNLNYTLSVSNAGPDSALNVTVTQSLPSGVTFVSASGSGWSCNEAAGTVNCTKAALAAGASESIAVVTNVNLLTTGDILTSGFVNSDTNDPSAFDNSPIQGTQVNRDLDGDGLLDSEEAILGTDPNDTDSDDDGVNDDVEVSDNTNPLDRGSFKQVLSTTLCSQWNGYLGGIMNYMEHVNISGSDKFISTSVYSQTGLSTSADTFTVSTNSQIHVDISQLAGYILNGYGQVCSAVAGGAPGDVSGQMVHYHPLNEFAFAIPFSNGLTGSQFVSFNTFQPSFVAEDSIDIVANWIQLSNLESSSKSGTLFYYAQDGSELASGGISIAGGGRLDLSAHNFGPRVVGLIEWRPDDATARFQLQNARYYYDNPMGQESFDSAALVPGGIGTGELLIAAFDTFTASAVLELTNTRAAATFVVAQVYSANGSFQGEARITLPAHGSQHIFINDLFSAGLGAVHIQSSAPTSTRAVVMQYERTENGGLSYAYALPARLSQGATLRAAYNTFSGQDCELLITNKTSNVQPVSISMTRSGGTVILPSFPLNVPALGTQRFDVCDFESANNIGTLTVQATNPDSIAAQLVRIGAGNAYRFALPVRE